MTTQFASPRGDATMSGEAGDRRAAVQEMVMYSLGQAEGIASELRKTNTRLVVAGISSSAACTLFAGITAARGPFIGEGPPGWQLACIISAVLAFGATLSIGLGQQLRISDRLSSANRCVGRLRSLDVFITAGSRTLEEVTNEFAEIEEDFPEYCERPRARLPRPPWPPPLRPS